MSQFLRPHNMGRQGRRTLDLLERRSGRDGGVDGDVPQDESGGVSE